jgi:hypothetical protein
MGARMTNQRPTPEEALSYFYYLEQNRKDMGFPEHNEQWMRVVLAILGGRHEEVMKRGRQLAPRFVRIEGQDPEWVTER